MGRRRWADDLEPSLASRGPAVRPRPDVDERQADHGPPVATQLLSLQAHAGNRAVAAAVRSMAGAGPARRPIVAQREKPTKGTPGKKGQQQSTPKPPPAWLKDAQAVLAEMAKTDKLLGNTTLRNYADLNAVLRKFEYGAWTQSATEIYIKDPYPKGSDRKDPALQDLIEQYIRYELRHEVEHVHQFARDGGPPKAWQRMLEYEKEAYTNDVKWLDGPGKSIVTDATVMADIRKQVNKNLKDVTTLLDGIAKLPPRTNVEQHLHKEMIRLKLIPAKSGIKPQDLYVQP